MRRFETPSSTNLGAGTPRNESSGGAGPWSTSQEEEFPPQSVDVKLYVNRDCVSDSLDAAVKFKG